MNLKGFSNAVKEIIKKQISPATIALVKTMPLGETNYKFAFILQGKNVKIASSLRSLPAIFDIAKRILPSVDYNLTIRIQSDKTKEISKRVSVGTSIEKLKEEMLFGQDAVRVFYETITTDDFEITYSEYEGTVIKFSDENVARRFLQISVGMFPFVDIEKENKNVEITCTFSIEKYEKHKTDISRKGNVKCLVKADGEVLGTKSGTFIF
jgi:redox-regulated HSP33 family molecular chaperone